MGTPFIIILVAILLVAGYVVMVYNSLQTLLTQIEAAVQEIGNQLKRQASLIPNLESSVKGFMKQEKDIFQMLTDARKSVQAASPSDMKSVEAAEQQLSAVLPRLQIAIEDNPELKSNETVQQFMNELRDTSDKLMYSRRAVIYLTQKYNQKLVTVPSSFVAQLFSFKKQAGLATPMSGAHVEVSEAETKDHKVSL
jgi:LemA protein